MRRTLVRIGGWREGGAHLQESSDVELHSHDEGVQQADIAAPVHLIQAIILIRILRHSHCNRSESGIEEL